MVFEKLDRGTTLETLLEIMRTAIIDGKYPPGAQLKQSLIAGELGVSQGMVRESLGRLVGERLVTAIPYRGFYVCQLTKDDVAEIFQMRIALETLAIKLSLPFSEQDIDRFMSLTRIAHDANLIGHRKEAISFANDFHREIVYSSGNSRLIESWNSLLAQCRHVTRNLGKNNGAQISSWPRDHASIVAALQSGDPALIESLIEEHLSSTMSLILQNWSLLVDN